MQLSWDDGFLALSSQQLQWWFHLQTNSTVLGHFSWKLNLEFVSPATPNDFGGWEGTKHHLINTFSSWNSPRGFCCLQLRTLTICISEAKEQEPGAHRHLTPVHALGGALSSTGDRVEERGHPFLGIQGTNSFSARQPPKVRQSFLWISDICRCKFLWHPPKAM